MNEQPKLPSGVGDMLRTTADNQLNFLTQIAEHIDRLELHIQTLETRITAMESGPNESN